MVIAGGGRGDRKAGGRVGRWGGGEVGRVAASGVVGKLKEREREGDLYTKEAG